MTGGLDCPKGIAFPAITPVRRLEAAPAVWAPTPILLSAHTSIPPLNFDALQTQNSLGGADSSKFRDHVLEVATDVGSDWDSASETDVDTDEYEYDEDDSISECEYSANVFPAPNTHADAESGDVVYPRTQHAAPLFPIPSEEDVDTEFGTVAKEWPAEEDPWKAEKAAATSVAIGLGCGTVTTFLFGAGVVALPMMVAKYFVGQSLLHGSQYVLTEPSTKGRGAFAKALPEKLGGHMTRLVSETVPVLEDVADVGYYMFEEVKRDTYSLFFPGDRDSTAQEPESNSETQRH
ncbi:unnamed protein product [Amoebophrya sp. A120]|nr:unnamed protein product [Amoebophrya sp. A120]|eukprot:GSA120T00004182001.1